MAEVQQAEPNDLPEDLGQVEPKPYSSQRQWLKNVLAGVGAVGIVAGAANYLKPSLQETEGTTMVDKVDKNVGGLGKKYIDEERAARQALAGLNLDQQAFAQNYLDQDISPMYALKMTEAQARIDTLPVDLKTEAYRYLDEGYEPDEALEIVLAGEEISELLTPEEESALEKEFLDKGILRSDYELFEFLAEIKAKMKIEALAGEDRRLAEVYLKRKFSPVMVLRILNADETIKTLRGEARRVAQEYLDKGYSARGALVGTYEIMSHLDYENKLENKRGKIIKKLRLNNK